MSILLALDGEQHRHAIARIAESSADVDHELIAPASDVPISAPVFWSDAAASARAPYLVFASDDFTLPAGWLSQMLAFATTHPDYSAIGVQVVDEDGSARALSEGFATQHRRDRARAFLREQATSQLDRSTLPIIGDGCLLVRAHDFAHAGGFDTRFQTRGALLDLCLKLIARGQRIGFDERVVLVSHSPEPDLKTLTRDLSLLRRRWGVERGSSPDALWVEGRTSASGSPPAAPVSTGHGRGAADGLPPFVDVGRRTYFGAGLRFLNWTSEERIHIGAYCSVAQNVTIFCGGNHSTDTASTYPFEIIFFRTTHPTRSFRTTRDTVIGSDVWIGEGAAVSGGVHVGHGAVISARSVVFEDVPPYAIVAGNPASIARYRFSQPTVDALLRIAWWDWPDERIQAELEWFFRPIGEFVARFDVSGGQREGTADAP